MKTANASHLSLATKQRCRYALFCSVTGFVYSILFSLPNILSMPMGSFGGCVGLMFQWLVITAFTCAAVSVMALWRVVFAIIFPLLTLVSGVALFFSLTLDVTLTPSVVELAAVNNIQTWSTLITWQLCAVAGLSFALGIAVGVYRFRHRWKASQNFPLACLGFVIAHAPFSFFQRVHGAVTAQLPYSIVWSVSAFLENRVTPSEHRPAFDNVEAVSSPTSPEVVIVVLGESLRADHLPACGYHRNTTPLLSTDTSVVWLQNVHTTPTTTYLSIPRILTRASEANPQAAFSEPSFLSLMNKAGFRTTWLTNQDRVNTYGYFMDEADTLIYANAAKSLYNNDHWADADLLPLLEKQLAPKDTKQMFIVHTIGSHWLYTTHHTPGQAVFKPELSSKVVNQNTPEQIINSYDNTIIATDLFLHSVIDLIKHKNALLIYISDHGEALGEDGKFLHAADYPPLHFPAAMVWMSEAYKNANPTKHAQLKKNAPKQMENDFLFHSVLHGAAVTCEVSDSAQSIFTVWD